ncbi:unnamed protein product [Pedinophyceae sp. YPF-701]|nr:unnamed protein product [Pedinophyceae sp. YPF-701]
MAAVTRQRMTRLPPEVNRILFVKNLPFSITAEEIYEIFGKYGALRQVRLGNAKGTKGTAYVVFEDIYDAKQACDHLSGFNVNNRYLIVLYHNTVQQHKKVSLDKEEEAIRKMQEQYGVDGKQHPERKKG